MGTWGEGMLLDYLSRITLLLGAPRLAVGTLSLLRLLGSSRIPVGAVPIKLLILMSVETAIRSRQALAMLKILLALGLFGTLTSTIYLLLVMVAAFRFLRRPKMATIFAPAVSLLKPLYGAEAGLRDYLEGFFQLDYPEYEILFCARTESDPGLAIAREISAKYPKIPVRILTSGEPPWPNARCYSLSEMKAAAHHDILVITDSDVRVSPEYLRSVLKPLKEENTGLVTCLYRGVATQGGFWAKLEGLGMSVEMTSGVLVANMLEGMRFALGPSMVVRKRCVDQIGGFQRLGTYYADDFMLGNLIAEKGNTVVLSDHVIDHCIVNTRFKKSLAHQWNWMKSTRFSRPKGHLGTGLTFGLPFGLLAFVAAGLLGYPWFGLGTLGWTVIARMLQSALVGRFVVEDKEAVRLAWLYPLRDLIGSILWMASYASRRVGWRDDLFELTGGGVVRLVPHQARGASVHH
jgi:ceramide glucosyltransferase